VFKLGCMHSARGSPNAVRHIVLDMESKAASDCSISLLRELGQVAQRNSDGTHESFA
jgi:hypothetical protein